MDLMSYLAVARRWWLTVLAATWVASLAAYLVASTVAPTYEARARLLVGPVNGTFDQVRAAAALVETYAQLVTSEPILSGAIAELDLDMTPRQLELNTEATASTVTRILTIDVQSNDPQRAADIANALGTQVKNLEREGARRPEGELTVIDPASADPDPVAPDVTVLTLLAGVAGMVGALALVVGVEHLSGTVKDRHDLVGLVSGGFLASVEIPTDFKPTPVRPLVVEERPDSRTATGYKLLAGHLGSTEAAGSLRAVLIVGTRAGDRSAEVAANLAAVLSHSGRRVLLVDASDTDGELSRLFGIAARDGLAELIASNRPGRQSTEIIRRIRAERLPGLSVVSAGASKPQLVGHTRLQEVRDLLLTDANLLIMHAGPLDRSASSGMWAGVVDGVVLVAQRDVTRRADIELAVERLQTGGSRLLGAVLVQPHRPGFFGQRSPRRSRSITSAARARR